jgi:putative chitinase
MALDEVRVRAARDRLAQALAEMDAALASVPEAVPAPSSVAPPPPPGTGLKNPGAFFTALKTSGLLGPTLSNEEVAGCQSILDAAAGAHPTSWCAYDLATAWHETGAVMLGNVEVLNYSTPERLMAVWPSRFPTVASAQPYIHNAKGLANFVYNGRMGNRVGTDDGWNYRGRGKAHITGRDMYVKADDILQLNGELVSNPDIACREDIAARILVKGMQDGWFTTRKLSQFINNSPTLEQYTNARVIINPDGNGDRVAKAALTFLSCLKAGEWQ